MERLAILIEASDVFGQDYLSGAKADVENWNSYLKSDSGGRWQDNEIKIFNKPSVALISQFLKNNYAKYCFVAFSGHGSYNNKTNKTEICLNDEEQNVPITMIKPKSEKGMLVIDACRGDETPSYSAVHYDSSTKALIESACWSSTQHIRSTMEVESSSSSNLMYCKYVPNVKSHRGIWDDALEKSHCGIVTMYATSEGQNAHEPGDFDGSVGGYFTTVLISTAKEWAKERGNKQCLNSKDAFDRAKKTLALYVSPEQQNPVYEVNKEGLHFPFAVKILKNGN